MKDRSKYQGSFYAVFRKGMKDIFTQKTVTAKEIEESIYVQVAIGKDKVISGNMSPVDFVLGLCNKIGSKAIGKIVITFSDYDDTTDEVHEIDEIRKWCQKVFSKYPYIFYYLGDKGLLSEGRQSFAACVGEFKMVHVGKRYTIEEIEKIGPFEFYTNPDTGYQIAINLNEEQTIRIITSMARVAKKNGDTFRHFLVNLGFIPGLHTPNAKIDAVVKSIRWG